MRAATGLFTTGLSAVSGVFLVLLMLLVVTDVAGRELIGRGVRGTTELTEILLAGLVFFGYPRIARNESHLRVDLVPLGPRMMQLRRIAAGLTGAAIFGAISWRMWEQSGRLALYGDSTPMLNIPLSLVLALMSFLAAVTALSFLPMILRALRGEAEPDQAEVKTE